ncbi:DUF1559 domain-containing protein [Planctomycetota bacterium]
MNRSAWVAVRTAFTLVELLVVISIIAMMVLMLLPAVNAARESARRAQCLSRMAQIGSAMHNYEMAFESFPPGVQNPTGPIVNRPEGLHRGWTIEMLPYLDEANLHGRIGGEESVYAEKFREIRQRFVLPFRCPSSSVRNGGESSYAAVHHDVEAPIDADNNGVFYLNSKTTRDDITDGLRYTFFLGEKVTESDDDLGWMSGTRATLRNTGTPIGLIPQDRFFRREELAEVSDDGKIETENNGEPEIIPTENENHVGGFDSDHPGGALFVFGDGSVRFIPESISTNVYQRHGHRSDGELINEDE